MLITSIQSSVPQTHPTQESFDNKCDRLIAVTKTKQHKEKQKTRLLLCLMLFLVLVFTPIILLLESTPLLLKIPLLIVLLLLCGLIFMLNEGGMFSKKYHQVLFELVAAKQVQTLGIISDALSTVPPHVLSTLKVDMVDLFNQTNSEHAGILSQKQEHVLWLYFVVTGTPGHTHQQHTLCAGACLQALSKIGGAQTLRRIQKLASNNLLGFHNQAVIKLACTCLPIVEARLAQTMNVDTLVRASSLTAQPNTLLRPASDTAQTATDAPEQLLRAVSAQDNAPPVPQSSRTVQAANDAARE